MDTNMNKPGTLLVRPRAVSLVFALLFLLFSSCFLSGGMSCYAQRVLAFPGAEGGGCYATGGRGGRVLVVNTLDDGEQPGTFRYAVTRKYPRIVVFSVAGTIHLKSGLNIRQGDLTIAGQTAPGDGICIADFPVGLNASNVIVRYLRFRMGDDAGEALGDGADAFGGRKQQNVIIDHCSISWSTDECASFYDNRDFTMQWCIVSESLRLSSHSKGPHGYGAIWGGVNASFHHNLLAHHDSRTPRFGPGAKYAGHDTVDVRNNVFYNCSGNGCYGAEAMHINFVNNYYKRGPATSDRMASTILAVNVKTRPGDFEEIHLKAGKFYLSGNVMPHDERVTADNYLGLKNSTEGNCTDEELRSAEPLATTPLSHTETAQEAYESVLSGAGCSLHRDAVDERIVDETRRGTATFHGLNAHNGDPAWKSKHHPLPGIIDSHRDLKPEGAADDWSPWPDLDPGEPEQDTDGDGMPDDWEQSHGLNPEMADAGGRDIDANYDNIEVYFNEIVTNK